jgi:hypothetical protein
MISSLPLRDYFAVVASLDALVTNDGSPLHAGPALGVPTVGILGPTVPEIWFPYDPGDRHQLLCKEIWCRPCHRHECGRMDCLDWIGVGEALRATARALNLVEGAVASATGRGASRVRHRGGVFCSRRRPCGRSGSLFPPRASRFLRRGLGRLGEPGRSVLDFDRRSLASQGPCISGCFRADSTPSST